MIDVNGGVGLLVDVWLTVNDEHWNWCRWIAVPGTFFRIIVRFFWVLLGFFCVPEDRLGLFRDPCGILFGLFWVSRDRLGFLRIFMAFLWIVVGFFSVPGDRLGFLRILVRFYLDFFGFLAIDWDVWGFL